MPMRRLIIYSTVGCHLCEQATALIFPFLKPLGIELVECDIANNDQLIDEYGVRIPVLKLENAAQDLSWPFTEEDFVAYVARSSSSG